jgi:hypothetical protein
MFRAMAVLLATAAAVLALVVPLDHGTSFVVGMIAAGAAAGGGAYAASTPEKKSTTESISGRARFGQADDVEAGPSRTLGEHRRGLGPSAAMSWAPSPGSGLRLAPLPATVTPAPECRTGQAPWRAGRRPAAVGVARCSPRQADARDAT